MIAVHLVFDINRQIAFETLILRNPGVLLILKIHVQLTSLNSFKKVSLGK